MMNKKENIDYSSLILRSKNLLSESENLIYRNNNVIKNSKRRLFEKKYNELPMGISDNSDSDEEEKMGSDINTENDNIIDRVFLIDFIKFGTPDFDQTRKFDKNNEKDKKDLAKMIKTTIDKIQSMSQEEYLKENKSKIDEFKRLGAQKFNDLYSSKIVGYEEMRDTSKDLFSSPEDWASPRSYRQTLQQKNESRVRPHRLLLEQEQNAGSNATLELKQKYYGKTYGDFISGPSQELLFDIFQDTSELDNKSVDNLKIAFEKFKVPNQEDFFEVMNQIKINPNKFKNISGNMIYFIDAFSKFDEIGDNFNPIDFLKQLASIDIDIKQKKEIIADRNEKRENLKKFSEYLCKILKIEINENQSDDTVKKLIKSIQDSKQQLKTIKNEMSSLITSKIEMNSWKKFSNYINQNKRALSENVILNFLWESGDLSNNIENKIILKDFDKKIESFDEILKKKVFEEFEIDSNQFSKKYQANGVDFDANQLIIWDSDLSDPSVIQKISYKIINFDRNQGSGDQKLTGDEIKSMIQKFQIVQGVFKKKINLPIGYSFKITNDRNIDFIIKIDEVLYKAIIEQKEKSDVVKNWLTDSNNIISTFLDFDFNIFEFEQELTQQSNDQSHFYYVINNILTDNEKYDIIIKAFENNQNVQNLSINTKDEIITPNIIQKIKTTNEQSIAFVFMNNGNTLESDDLNLQAGKQLDFDQLKANKQTLLSYNSKQKYKLTPKK